MCCQASRWKRHRQTGLVRYPHRAGSRGLRFGSSERKPFRGVRIPPDFNVSWPLRVAFWTAISSSSIPFDVRNRWLFSAPRAELTPLPSLRPRNRVCWVSNKPPLDETLRIHAARHCRLCHAVASRPATRRSCKMTSPSRFRSVNRDDTSISPIASLL